MFWRFNTMCTTNIDTLLEDEDITLQKLMDEDDIIQECKSNNRKLINFLVKSEVLHNLVKLVTKEPNQDAAYTLVSTRYKYNNIAAELFSCDVAIINDTIVSEESLLAELCEFVYDEPPLNPLMASFFSKTMAVLISRKADKMLEYLKNKEGFLSQLLKHIGTSAIMDLLCKLVTSIENKTSKFEFAQWLCSENLIERLVALFSSESDAVVQGNASQLLADYLKSLRETHAQNSNSEMNMEQGQIDQDVDPIVCALESKSTSDRLLEHMLRGDIGESSIVHGVAVLLALLSVHRPPGASQSLANTESESVDRNPPDPVITPCIRNTVEAIIPRLKDLHEVLLKPHQKAESQIPNSSCDKPFGFTRLQITRLITALIATGSSEVQKELATLGTMSVLMDMMLEFDHSNFLHAQVEKSIQYALGLEPINLLQPFQAGQEAPDNSHLLDQPISITHPLLSSLITETCLLRRILDAWKVNEQHESQPGGRRRAYMGHLVLIANYVIDFEKQGKNSTKIHQLIQGLDEDLRSDWRDFVDNKMAETNRNNEIVSVKPYVAPPRASSDEEETDVRHNFQKDGALQEVFSEYQMEIMSKHVVTQYGFADTQFNDNDDQLRSPPETLVNIALPEDADELTHQSELFERVCNERMEMRTKSNSATGGDESGWMEGERRRSSENTSTIRQESSSSDEEDKIGDDANDDMDIDPPIETSSVAMDAGNPWENAPVAKGEESDDWANFAKADFSCCAAPMDVSETPITDDPFSEAATTCLSPTEKAGEGLAANASTENPNGPV